VATSTVGRTDDRRDDEVVVGVVTEYVYVALLGGMALVTTYVGAVMFTGSPLLVDAWVVIGVAIQTLLGRIGHASWNLGVRPGH